MEQIIAGANNTWAYIKTDYKSYPLRFCAELFAWVCSVTSAIIFATTVPNIPIIPLYIIYISGCFAAAWSCYTRRSFGLLANASFMIVIDSIGLLRMLINS